MTKGWNGAALLAVAFAAVASVPNPAAADPKDYRFEAVQPHVAASANAAIAARLVHVPTGKPVTGAIILSPKMEMPMPGMAPMPTTVKALAPDGTGVYPFTADLSMAGSWVLTLAAKVQGESATVTGTVPFTAASGSHNH